MAAQRYIEEINKSKKINFLKCCGKNTLENDTMLTSTNILANPQSDFNLSEAHFSGRDLT